MPQRREHPYIWATWLPRLLTGENSCEWAVWFKAHFVKTGPVNPPTSTKPSGCSTHTSLVNERIGNWEVGGYDCDVEVQNAFALQGRTAWLSCRPDIIAHREDQAVVVDAKTGQEGPSHAVQVMIYCTPSAGPPAVPEGQIAGKGHLPRSHRARAAGRR